MSNSLFWSLVLKDLRLYRYFILITLAVGVVSLFLLTQGNRAFFVGASMALCSLIVLLIMLVQRGMIEERKAQVHYFLLSLPITGQQYVLAKALAIAVSFFVPWLLIGGGALVLLGLSPVKGFIPFTLTVLMYFPLYFACAIGAACLRKPDGPIMGVIVFYNVAINMLIPGLLSIPSVAATVYGPAAIWTSELLLVLAIEVGVALAVLLVALWRQSSRTEYL